MAIQFKIPVAYSALTGEVAAWEETELQETTTLKHTMKVLVATEKPFAKEAVAGIRTIVEEAGFELALLEKYADKADLVAAVAELALAMMIYMARNRFTPGTGSELQGKTLAIHAYGNVGRLVAKKGKALGMRVIAFDPFVRDAALFENDGVEAVASVEELYRRADYLSLHIPATAETKGSIGHDLLVSMPKGATLVNTARKEVIDEAGVMQAMREREDLKYVTDIAPAHAAEMEEAFGKRFFATPKKQGAETAEANINAGLAAARQTVGYLVDGNTRFQVNR